MKKLVKILTIAIVVTLFSLNFSVFAAPENNTASSNETTTTQKANTTNTSTTQKSSTNANSNSTMSTKVSTVDPEEEKALRASDIINIFLIAICIILVILGIAILIRLR